MSPRTANRRVRLLGVMLVVALAASLARAAWIQGVHAQSYVREANAQHQGQPVVLDASRGSIFDRTGVELARGEPSVTVFADPAMVKQPGVTVDRIGAVLRLDDDERKLLLERLGNRASRFAYVARQIDAKRAEQLERLELKGIHFVEEEKRLYPQGSVAAQLLGFVNVDNEGLEGLELKYDRMLKGREGEQVVVRTPKGRIIDTISSRDPVPGSDITLSIDQAIQLEVEQVLRQTIRTSGAKGASAVVLDPLNGEVLAMASAPTYDANRFGSTDWSVHRNRAVIDAYEPGSTFKLVTVAGTLSEGLVTPSTAFTLPYSIQVADKVIHDAHERGTERMTVSTILEESSNVGAITLAQKLGEERLAKWIERFGFGKPTGIDFPGESSGMVAPVQEWWGSQRGTIPIGQGISVTGLQLAAAYAVIANGGEWVQPHLVLRVGDERTAAPKRRRVVSPGVAAQLMKMLRGVVDEGTGTTAAIEGYEVAGKTGTAAKPDSRGGYSSRYVASFVGMVPASKPRLVILVSVDEPSTTIWGGVVAAPAFREIALFGLRYLEVPPDAKPTTTTSTTG